MRLTIILLFIVLNFTAGAQTSSYRTDLAELKSIVVKTPSFKVQIKGKKLSAYHQLYQRLVADSVSDPDSYKYFYNLTQLLFPLRDNHMGIMQIPDYTRFKTRESIDSFIISKEFRDYPSIQINIDSLKDELAKKPSESVEGIYHYGKFYSVGVFKTGEKEYAGVVIDSDTKFWTTGQVAIHLYEIEPDRYKAIYGHPYYKYLFLQPNEKYRNQSLINSWFPASYSQGIYTKKPEQIDYANLPKETPKFGLKNLDDQIQYLLIRTFQTNKTTSQKSLHFYDSIRNLLKSPYLILDLRNNEGGAKKEMKKYYSLMKKYVRKGKLYVLLNNGTLSQAEIFTLKLKKLKNVITVGQTTRGMLTYGSNYGRRITLPSGKFSVYPTDMKGSSFLLSYEDYGITPDIPLSDERDWIEQVMAIIDKH